MIRLKSILTEATLATDNDFREKVKSWEIITQTGIEMRDGWRRLAELHGLSITISGIPALSTYSFNSIKALEYKTLIAQEMLAKGYLASTNFYASTAHDKSKLSLYFEALDSVFSLISSCEKGYDVVENHLKGPVCHAGFKRLN
jgi:glutamate-1-semialdehyde 2,1-aminomutase